MPLTFDLQGKGSTGPDVDKDGQITMPVADFNALQQQIATMKEVRALIKCAPRAVAVPVA